MNLGPPVVSIMRATARRVDASRQFSAAPFSPPGKQVAVTSVSLECFKVKRKKGLIMSIQLQIEEMPNYLQAKFTGVGAVEEVWQQFGLIAEHCKRANKNKLHLDFTEVHEVHGEVSLADRYFLGEEAQIFARYKLQVAVAYKPDRLENHRFGELVARNRGVNVLVFTNVEDAEKWLLK